MRAIFPNESLFSISIALPFNNYGYFPEDFSEGIFMFFWTEHAELIFYVSWYFFEFHFNMLTYIFCEFKYASVMFPILRLVF